MTVERAHQAATWEKIVAVVCAVSVLIVVLILVLRDKPFADPNNVTLIRIILSLAIAIIGAVIPGFLQVGLTFKGVIIRSGGALALFIITFFFTPTVIPVTKLERTTEKTSQDISRMLTKFSNVYVQAVYELPDSRPEVQKLKQAFSEISRLADLNNKSIDGFSRSYTARPTNTKSGNGITNTEIVGEPITSIELDNILDAYYVSLVPQLLDSKDVIEFLIYPKLVCDINREPRSVDQLLKTQLQLADRDDFELKVHKIPVKPDEGHFGSLILDPNKNKILVSWNGFEYPTEHWFSNGKIMSINDLDRSQFVTMLSNWRADRRNLDSIAGLMKPIWINLQFDNHVVTLSQFESSESFMGHILYYSTFPSASEILEGKASKPIASESIGGY